MSNICDNIYFEIYANRCIIFKYAITNFTSYISRLELYMKLSEASPLVKRIITYEYFSCMSPNTEWGSSRRLLARYLEMIGKDPAIIDEIYPR